MYGEMSRKNPFVVFGWDIGLVIIDTKYLYEVRTEEIGAKAIMREMAEIR